MKDQSVSSTSAMDSSVWIILAGLLLISALIGAGTLAIINMNNANIGNQQAQAPTAPVQPAPAPAPPPAKH